MAKLNSLAASHWVLLCVLHLSVASYGLQVPSTSDNHTATVGENHFIVTGGLKTGSDKRAGTWVFNGSAPSSFTMDTFIGMTNATQKFAKGTIATTGSPNTFGYNPGLGVATGLSVSVSGHTGCVSVTITSVDQNGATQAVDHNVNLTLDSTTGGFYATPQCKIQGTGTTINSGSSTPPSAIYFKSGSSATLTISDTTGSPSTTALLNTGTASY